MAKAVLLSIVVIMIAVPVFTARDPSPRQALRNTILLTVVLNVLYLLAVRYLYPRLL